VAMPALALRPQLFAIVLFAATVLILVERAAHPRRLWLIPVDRRCVGEPARQLPADRGPRRPQLARRDRLPPRAAPCRRPEAAARRSPARLTGLALIGRFPALATLVTPFGLDGWRYIENLARNPEITSEVSEWRPALAARPRGRGLLPVARDRPRRARVPIAERRPPATGTLLAHRS
jgi:hypothetical protein